jgi:hypothetical protein
MSAKLGKRKNEKLTKSNKMIKEDIDDTIKHVSDRVIEGKKNPQISVETIEDDEEDVETMNIYKSKNKNTKVLGM